MSNSEAPKVYEAIAAVSADLALSGISKDDENSFDRYKFRGIDAVYNHLAKLLPRHGLVIIPRFVSREVVERTNDKGKALFYVTVEAEFDFVATVDGSKHTARAYGEAMDRGDKATNKAMSAAYKYVCFQAFCIPTEGDNDADLSSHDVLSKHDETVRRHEGVLEEFRAALEADDYARAYATWSEIPKEDAMIIYRAPSKGGWLTTQERAAMKSNEWSAARKAASEAK